MFREKGSGATIDRSQIERLLAEIGPGDEVTIPAFDRPSRDTTDLLNMACDIRQVGAGLRSIAEPLIDTMSGLADVVLT